jgi:RNA polymerase sigma factor (sigma-70 family)
MMRKRNWAEAFDDNEQQFFDVRRKLTWDDLDHSAVYHHIPMDCRTVYRVLIQDVLRKLELASPLPNLSRRNKIETLAPGQISIPTRAVKAFIKLAGIEDASFRGMRKALPIAINELTPREKEVIRLRFGLGDEEENTYVDIAKRCGISLSEVRGIEAMAIRKLRLFLAENY